MNKVLQSLGLADMQLTHIALAVHDLEKAMASMASLGLSFPAPFEVAIPTRYRGSDTVAGLRAAFAPGKPIPMELVQPTGGSSSVATFLQERGEGVQHFGYAVEDMPETLARVNDLGMDLDWQIDDEHGPAIAFVSAPALRGMYLELVRREPAVTLTQWIKR